MPPSTAIQPAPAPPAPTALERWPRGALVSLLCVPPLVYLAVVFALQRPDRLGASDIPEPLARLVPAADDPTTRLLCDDYDTAAMALRGLNAHLGRTPGRPDPPLEPRKEFERALDDPEPLHDRYFLEWPHAALALFRLAYLLQPPLREPVSPAILDARYHNLVGHVPRTDAERDLWQRFRQAIRFYSLVMVLCHLALIAVLAQGYEPGVRPTGALLLLVLPAALYFTVNRFDTLPALLTALSFFFLGRRHAFLAGVCLAAATMVKAYPLLLAPLVFRYLLDQWRPAAAFAVAYALTGVAFLLPPLLLSDRTATLAPYLYQLTREPEAWTGYGYVFPEAWQNERFIRLGAQAAIVLACFVTRPRNLDSLLRRGVLVLIVFVALPVFWSPQWVLWLLPLIVPLARRRPVVFGLAVVLDVVSYASFPVIFDLSLDRETKRQLVAQAIFARYGILAALALVLAWAELRPLALRYQLRLPDLGAA